MIPALLPHHVRTPSSEQPAAQGDARALPARPRRLAVLQGQLGIGGSERQLQLLLSTCDRAAWTPHVYAVSNLGEVADEIAETGVPVTLLTGSPAHRLWQFRREVRRQGAEALLSWSSWTNAFALLLPGRRFPRVGSFRNAGFADLPERHRPLWSWASRARLTTVICNSAETAEELRRHCRPSQHVRFVPNAVEPVDDVRSARQTWRRELGIADDEVLVVGIGRISPQKAFERFVEAVELCSASQPVRAVIVGPDHNGAAALEARIEASPLPPGTVRYLGPSLHTRELVCAADVYLLSSTHEGMPNVVLEAMAAGVPCVTTPVSGITSVLTHEVDGLVAGHDPRSLADALLRLARDPALRRSMGERARRRVALAHVPQAVYAPVWTELADGIDRARSARAATVALRTRAADVALCLLAAPVVLPVAAAVAAMVRLSGPGPVLHRGVRVGHDGKPFELYKFRTMHLGAEREGPGITAAGDSRVTAVGRLLRRSKVDELPQLLNVLRGEMSLVGPRPEDPRYVDVRKPAQLRALSVRPGLTSPASIRFRDEEAVLVGPDWERVYREQVQPQKLAVDCAYLDDASMSAYARVLVQTVAAVAPRPRRRPGSAAPAPSEEPS